MSSNRRKLQEDTHFRVLRLRQENLEMPQRKLAAAVVASVGGTRHGSRGISPSRERGTSVFSRFVQQSLLTVQNFVYRKIDILEPVIGSRRTSQTAKNICCHVMFHELNLRICAECTRLPAR
jgi:hypothetical protein